MRFLEVAVAATGHGEVSGMAAEGGHTDGLSIHLAPEIVGTVAGVPITNTLLTVWLVMALLILGAYFMRSRLALVPSRLQVVVESVIGYVYDYVKEVLGSDSYARRFFPLIATIFIFILSINWIGLLPGIDSIGFYHGGEFTALFHPGNTDLNITIAFALVAFLAIELSGILMLGLLKYGGKFVNFSSPIAFAVGIIELFSEFARLIAFSFRLFGNIFAGKTLLLVVMFFVPFIVPVPFLAYEIFVGFIQAFIFAILTLFFVKMAIEEPH
jgi:F-type H+-transporting ATPase subunit a